MQATGDSYGLVFGNKGQVALQYLFLGWTLIKSNFLWDFPQSLLYIQTYMLPVYQVIHSKFKTRKKTTSFTTNMQI